LQYVKPKKNLGQHFLHDEAIAKRITASLTGHANYKHVLEIGPGTGVLSKYLMMDASIHWIGMEIDPESVEYLKTRYPEFTNQIIMADFLKLDIKNHFSEDKIAVIGNFPYNISSQILFKVLENRSQIVEVVGMFQKEVAQRIAAGPGGKVNGILSVLCRAFYEIEYLFQVNENVFNPPPKVKSAVIRLKRNHVEQLECDERLFFKVVKTAFNQRRKTLRNSLKQLNINWSGCSLDLSGKRAEELEVEDFIAIVNAIPEKA
jgi:16S rRNA (adenine1518-N6/adenine1519-N6)-dimethyltransferase